MQVKFNVVFPQLNDAQRREVKAALAGATYPPMPATASAASSPR